MHLRSSRVLHKLRRGEVAGCVKLNLSDPRAVEIAVACHIDCVWLDLEHVPNDLHDIENQIRAAKMHDADALVRVPRGSYSDLIRPLEMDAAGIMIPHVMNAAEAREIARQTRFHPIGRRALDGGNADGAYGGVGLDQYIEHANTQRLVVVQIEDPEALAELDDIAAVEGLDMLFFGPGDFSHALGIPGEMTDPRIAEARERVAQAARRHGKFAGTVSSVEELTRTLALGYRFVSIGADVVGLRDYFANIAAVFGRESSKRDPTIYR